MLMSCHLINIFHLLGFFFYYYHYFYFFSLFLPFTFQQPCESLFVLYTFFFHHPQVSSFYLNLAFFSDNQKENVVFPFPFLFVCVLPPSFVILMQICTLCLITCHTATMEKWALQLRLLAKVHHISCSCFLRSSALRTVYIYKNNLLLPSSVIHSFLLLTLQALIDRSVSFAAEVRTPVQLREWHWL